MQATPWIARTKLDYAQTLAASTTPSAHARAEQLSREATALYNNLGIRGKPAGTLTDHSLSKIRHCHLANAVAEVLQLNLDRVDVGK